MNTDPENLARLAAVHLRRYENLMFRFRSRPDNSNVNPTETLHYLQLWKSIRAKAYMWENFSPAERAEVMEALEDDG
jgi:exonuclease I